MSDEVNYYEKIREDFRDLAVDPDRPSIIAFACDNALAIVEKIKEWDVKISGIESLWFYDDGRIQPSMEHSPDYDALTKEESWIKAVEDINKFSKLGLSFEFLM